MENTDEFVTDANFNGRRSLRRWINRYLVVSKGSAKILLDPGDLVSCHLMAPCRQPSSIAFGPPLSTCEVEEARDQRISN